MPSKPLPSPIKPLPVADFEGGKLTTLMDTPWVVFTDASMSGKSTLEASVASPGAKGSKGAMLLTGKLTTDIQWGGFAGITAQLSTAWPSTNLSRYTGVQFLARGDGKVYRAVVGKENVKLIASGNVTAKYLLNANVEAAGEIFVEDSIINCDVFSNNRISVVARQGKIIGGKTTALYEIVVNVSGSPNETETQLSVGRNLFIEKELLDIHKEVSKWRAAVNETITKLKLSFGEKVFENPKEFLEMLPPVKKKNCLLLLKELGNNNSELKKFVEQSKEVQNKLKLDREPCIVVKNRVYPGTVLSIKKSIKRIDSPIDNVRYYEDPVEKVIRFSPAV